MKRKTLILTLITVGLVLAATSAAFSLYPSNWFTKDSPISTSTKNATVPAPAAPLPAGTPPN